MSIEVIFTMKRPNTSKDFWWESSDPEIVEMCRKIDVLASTQNIQRSYGKSPDNLIYESRFVASDREAWNHFMNSVIIEMPNMLEQRNAYLGLANHTIRMVINNANSGDVIKNTDAPTWALGE